MPYSQEHKDRTRARILASALHLFSQRGFAQVTIDAIMAHARLTRGGFYAHFDSKEQLYAAAIRHGVHTSMIAAMSDAPKGLKTLQRIVDGYLSREHVDGQGAPCPLAFFATDVGVRTKEVRSTYTIAFGSLVGAINSHVSGLSSEELSLPITVLMVGAVAISAAVIDPTLKDNILATSRRVIMDLVGTVERKTPTRFRVKPSPASRRRAIARGA